MIVLNRRPQRAPYKNRFELPVTDDHDPTANQLLAALPAADLAQWRQQLEYVEWPAGLVLCESGGQWGHAYFPTSAIVSLLYVAEGGASAEIAMVGHEGVVGVPLFMGGETTTHRAVVRSAGSGYRLKASIVKSAFKRSAVLRHLFLRYTQALITLMAQTAVCNRHHSVEQHLCRWLLMGLDRVEGDTLDATQELIAAMLGVRREGVTEAALKLQQAGVIRYRRGQVGVLDRPALEHRACECYAVVRAEYDRLLPRP